MNTNMNTETAASPERPAATSGLAVVGFVALIIAGLWLALYSTRFVPGVVNRIGSAAVYLGSVFSPAPGSTVSVVPTPAASTTIPFGTTGTTPTTSTTVTPTKTSAKPKPVAGVGTNTTTYEIGTTKAAALSGLADLAVTIDTTGYLTSASTSSFVASTTVPHGDNAAVRFTIKNVGTNWSGTWTFSASVPTYPTYTYTSQPQQSLAPGDSIDYTLGFNQAISGTSKVITVTINPGVSDSNKSNNSAAAAETILP